MGIDEGVYRKVLKFGSLHIWIWNGWSRQEGSRDKVKIPIKKRCGGSMSEGGKDKNKKVPMNQVAVFKGM